MKTVHDVEEAMRARIEEMLERPSMYGTKLVVEMQMHMCLEVIGSIRWPDYSAKDKTTLFFQPIQKVLGERFGTSQVPAAAHSLNMSDFVDVLRKVRDESYKLIETGLEVLDDSTEEE